MQSCYCRLWRGYLYYYLYLDGAVQGKALFSPRGPLLPVAYSEITSADWTGIALAFAVLYE